MMVQTLDNLPDVYKQLERRVARLERGSTGGTLQPPDFVASLDLTSLSVTATQLYAVNDIYEAYVSLSFTVPTQDPNALTKDWIDHYEGSYSLDSQATWIDGFSSDAPPIRIGPLAPGASVHLRARAVTVAGVKGDWAVLFHTVTSDVNAPDQPSTPVVSSRFGNLIISWDGKDVGGDPMPDDFKEAMVHVSTTSATFTPNESNRIYRGFSGGTLVHTGLTPGTLYWVRLVAYDTSDLPSAPSTAASATIQAINAPDITAGAVTANAVETGALTADKMALGVLSQNALLNAGFEDTGVRPPVSADVLSMPGWTSSMAGADATSTGFQYASGSASSYRGLGKAYIGNDGGGVNGGTIQSDYYSVLPGTQMQVAIYAVASGTGTLRVQMYVDWKDATETVTSVALAAFNVSATAYTLYSDLWTVPAGAVTARVRFQAIGASSPTGASSWIFIDDTSFLRMGFGAVQIDPSGIKMWDEVGAETISLSAVGAGATFARFGGGLAQISEDGSGKFTNVTVDDVLRVRGDTLDTILDRRGRGLVAWGYYSGARTGTITTAFGLFDLAFTWHPGRMYKITTEVTFYPVGSDGDSYLSWFAARNAVPSLSSTLAYVRRTGRINGGLYHDKTAIWHSETFGISGLTDGDTVRLLLAVTSPVTGVKVEGGDYPPRMTIEDIGPAFAPTAAINNGSGSSSVTPKQPYFLEVGTSWNRNYLPSNSYTSYDPGHVYQGLYNSSTPDHSLFGFADLVSTLSAVDITKVELVLNYDHWYYNAGGTAHIEYHGILSDPGTSAQAEGTLIGEQAGVGVGLRSFDITGIAASLKSGAIRGFGLGRGGSTNRILYGRAVAADTRLRITGMK